MLIKEKLGNISSFNSGSRTIDPLVIEWHEANKRILHKTTRGGVPITLKFLNENPALKQDDVLYADEHTLITVEILPCTVIAITPASMLEASFICYEIGNKHLPLYVAGEELLVPYDEPLFNLLKASGYTVKMEQRKLNQPIKTSVQPHAHQGSSSLFNKILKLTNS